MVVLDAKDRKLLYELSLNARTPVKQLASTIQLSESATSRRIDKLRENDVLLGTQPLIDNSRLGYPGYRSYCNFLGTTADEEQEIRDWLINHETVSVIAWGSGAFQILLMSWVQDETRFETFLSRFRERYRDKIADLETHKYVKTYNYSHDYLVDEDDEHVVVTGGRAPVEHDKLDERILKSLIASARKPALAVAREIDEPAKTVANRLRKMEQNGIIAGYGINVNQNLLGYTYYKLNIVLHQSYSLQRLLEYAKKLSQAVYVDHALSPYDFELSVEVRDRDELETILDEIKELTGGIREAKIFSVKRYEQLSYVSF